MLVLLALGCAGDDDTSNAQDPDAGGRQGGTGSTILAGRGAQATVACLEACDDQIGAGCPGTTEIYRPFCENICENTTEQTADECLDELLALEECRAALTWECDSFGGAQPTTTCAAESGACLQCMGGHICEAPP